MDFEIYILELRTVVEKGYLRTPLTPSLVNLDGGSLRVYLSSFRPETESSDTEVSGVESDDRE